MSHPKTSLSWSALLRKPSIIFLILMNMVPVMGVFLFDWNVGFLMLIYWIETVLIGAFNLPKILTAGWRSTDPANRVSLFGNLFLVAFFTIHYGLFNFGHFSFLNEMFDLPSLNRDILIAVGGLSLSHAFSLIVNWFGKREYAETTANAQMFKPYGRVVIMHVTILIGGIFLLGSDGTNLGPLILLIMLKTVSDVIAHAVSHGWRESKTGTA